MRLGVGLAAVALGLLAGCADEESADLSAELGCGEIDGLGHINGKEPFVYIVVGETVETNEASAAFVELACRLAARQPKDQPLWVGLPDHIGGATDADQAMRKRFRELVAKGALMILGSASEGHTTGTSRREEAERRWANTIMASMESAGASRALLMVPRLHGVAKPVRGPDERYADYTPMPLFLPEGQVVNLEIGRVVGIGAPTVRIYTEMRDGYMGLLALASLTPARIVEPDRPAD